MKCLEKDRSRRYETANGLFADIQRHLNNEPVTAAGPGTVYQLMKLVRKYRTGFASAAAVIAALVLGVVTTTWQAVVAREEADTADAVMHFMTDDLLGEGDPLLRPTEALTLLGAIDLAVPKLNEKFRDRPLIEAALRARIGKAYWLHGRTLDGESFLKRALEIYQRELGDDAEETLSVVAELCNLYKKRGIQWGEKNTLANKYLPLAEKALGETHSVTLDPYGNGTREWIDCGTRDGEAETSHQPRAQSARSSNNIGRPHFDGRTPSRIEAARSGKPQPSGSPGCGPQIHAGCRSALATWRSTPSGRRLP